MVELGGEVIVTDPETDTASAEPVTNTIVGSDDRDFTDLTVADPSDLSKSSTIASTLKHSYWDETVQRWTNASDLRIGEHLRTADGKTTSVLQVRNYRTSPRSAYNLTIATFTRTMYWREIRQSWCITTRRPVRSAQMAGRFPTRATARSAPR
ncbi:polymorphic toxin-type HINT domain-containing protein [Kitasatospora sp. NPDC028055]|uniref:polymorphic toxin-type HINT domain-containing protein n=1 Tax=Kitasatospora sp. NPDC028055 TaxID=3155653 RepID=UPI0033CC6025